MLVYSARPRTELGSPPWPCCLNICSACLVGVKIGARVTRTYLLTYLLFLTYPIMKLSPSAPPLPQLRSFPSPLGYMSLRNIAANMPWLGLGLGLGLRLGLGLA